MFKKLNKKLLGLILFFVFSVVGLMSANQAGLFLGSLSVGDTIGLREFRTRYNAAMDAVEDAESGTFEVNVEFGLDEADDMDEVNFEANFTGSVDASDEDNPVSVWTVDVDGEADGEDDQLTFEVRSLDNRVYFMVSELAELLEDAADDLEFDFDEDEWFYYDVPESDIEDFDAEDLYDDFYDDFLLEEEQEIVDEFVDNWDDYVDIEVVEKEEIEGVMSDKFRFSLDVDEIVEELEDDDYDEYLAEEIEDVLDELELRFYVWIAEDESYVTKITAAVDLDDVFEIEVEVTFSDFGEDIVVEAPADATELEESEIFPYRVRMRDTEKLLYMNELAAALESYNIDEGEYPDFGSDEAICLDNSDEGDDDDETDFIDDYLDGDIEFLDTARTLADDDAVGECAENYVMYLKLEDGYVLYIAAEVEEGGNYELDELQDLDDNDEVDDLDEVDDGDAIGFVRDENAPVNTTDECDLILDEDKDVYTFETIGDFRAWMPCNDESSRTVVNLYDASDDEAVKTLYHCSSLSQCSRVHYFTWDGLIDGAPVRDGEYYLRASFDIDGEKQTTQESEKFRTDFSLINWGLVRNPGPGGVFPDVPANHPYLQAINWMRAQGHIQGYPDGTFRPSQVVQRDELVKMVTETVGAGGYSAATRSYRDVSQNDWSYSYIMNASNRGWVQGYPDGTFRPANPVTRAEAIKVAMVANNIPSQAGGSYFVDVTSNDWFFGFVSSAYANNLVGTAHVAASQFRPNDPMTRAEVAEMLYRMSSGRSQRSYSATGYGAAPSNPYGYSGNGGLIGPNDVPTPIGAQYYR
jgi:hypothetical protein